jgi:uncharacterized protein YdhG (YjbR/CyaY superfamily)
VIVGQRRRSAPRLTHDHAEHYLPHSGSVFPQLKDELKGYATSLGALRFDIDRPLPVPLVEKLIAVRLRQAFPD